jgi:hypothetical protein
MLRRKADNLQAESRPFSGGETWLKDFRWLTSCQLPGEQLRVFRQIAENFQQKAVNYSCPSKTTKTNDPTKYLERRSQKIFSFEKVLVYTKRKQSYFKTVHFTNLRK